LNQALLDQHRSVYRGMIQPGSQQTWLKSAVTAYNTVSVNEGNEG